MHSGGQAGPFVFKAWVNNDPVHAEVPTTITLYVPERDPYLPLRAFTCLMEEFVSNSGPGHAGIPGPQWDSADTSVEQSGFPTNHTLYERIREHAALDRTRGRRGVVSKSSSWKTVGCALMWIQ